MAVLIIIVKEKTTITLRETAGIDRINEPITIGVPFPMGELSELSLLCLKDIDSGNIPCQKAVLAKWSDESLKWVLLDFQVTIKAGVIKVFELIWAPAKTTYQIQSVLNVNEDDKHLVIDTGACIFYIDKFYFRPFDRVCIEGRDIIEHESTAILLKDDSRNQFNPKIKHIFIETKGEQRVTVKAEGQLISSDNHYFCKFYSRISFFAYRSLVKIDFTILNPKPSKHPGGLWDLGDKGSIFFKELSLSLGLKPTKYTKITCKIDEDRVPMVYHDVTPQQQKKLKHFELHGDTNIKLYQDSSGGECWDSINHVNRNNEVKNTYRGFRIYKGEEVTYKGLRANPFITIENENGGVETSVEYFWQNFPKAIETKANALKISLFPEQYNDVFELQGGEQKTHTIYLQYFGRRKKKGDLLWIQNKMIPELERDWYEKTKAIPWFASNQSQKTKVSEHIINSAIIGDNTFFHRRELIDEYGWRNFGELYADHESMGYAGEGPFISHYNNQYDGIFGFLKQFAKTGDTKWFILANQLCSHVTDIDIYHTNQDRLEYNGGLFWHTEHYIPAETATHRCFSRFHENKRNLAAYGGGPSLSHNYTTGLLLFYYMTGNVAARDAVYKLADFIIKNIAIENTITAYVFNSINKFKENLIYFIKQRAVVKTNKVYSLDGPGRASGNSLNTLIDAFLLTDELNYIQMADYLIVNCIGPDDDIEKRDLLDIENRWMYTVFLQALCKYVDLKEGKKEYDEMWKYARDSLVHYARWMAENENPYLDQKDKLEYPNETWACQDLRKCHILLYVANYVEYSLGITFIKKAENLYSKAMRQLNGFTSKDLTRPIVLLMLNDHLFKEAQSIYNSTAFSSPIKTDKKLNINLDKKRNKYSNRFLHKVLSFSFRHEYWYVYWKFWRRLFGG